MKEKRTLRICICALIISCLVCGIYMYNNRTTKREPTQAEIDAIQVYKPDLSNYPEEADTEMALLLSMCTSQGDVQIGDNWYTGYTSTVLPDILYQCEEILQIAMSQEGELNISYQALEGKQVILTYNEQGLFELVVYDKTADTMYHEINGTVEIWENFSSGIQFGA